LVLGLLCKRRESGRDVTINHKVDHNACSRYSNAAPLLTTLIRDPNIKGQFNYETLLNTMAVDDHSAYRCIECLKACPLNLH